MKLHLHVKTCYFNEIKCGSKTVEYRAYNNYWIRQIVGLPGREPRDFAGIVIYNAYRPGPENRIEFPWRGWSLKKITHPHFGPDKVKVFAIKLSAQ